jgi:hypothetical protein
MKQTINTRFFWHQPTPQGPRAKVMRDTDIG